MLDADTKRRIDACRDILVGKVPDPKSQVEQITIALIYKFMDDMDAEAEELGGKRTFFAGDYARYGWAQLMAPGLGGFDVLALYSEAIAKMPENPGVPALFRDIFKNAYLPYRDPETLKSFLKEINYFSYDHSERLGDAFEYLLSVLGSQGDAGQFRTPRHIIDFMVEVMNPQKHESVLDPACGTAGFLISAWKHILKNNSSSRNVDEGYSPKTLKNLPPAIPGNLLTPDERARLASNIRGYDISPDMVRLSLVNLYLHGFADPHVVEYDTLTQDDKWNEVADVILANPPFMSPKGGIKPHKRFSVQATRSEVLFVDYMAEHLTATGRAAIVVPEGIIFQSGTAYKSLRKMLVDTSLVAVVSLPAGVFNPYSGVKTSILILDKRVHKQTDSVLFVKVMNDGFNLGAQRRAVVNSDLPEATRLLRSWMTAPQAFEGEGVMAQAVARGRIGENGDFNLSGERYVLSERALSSFQMTTLDTLCDLVRGSSPRPQGDPKYFGGAVPRLMVADITRDGMRVTPRIDTLTEEGAKKSRPMSAGSVVMAVSGNPGLPAILQVDACIHDGFVGFRDLDTSRLLPEFFYYVLLANKESNKAQSVGAVFMNLTTDQIRAFSIPIPPLEVQHQIVAEIEGYQKIIDGARQVLDNYKPHIAIDPAWPLSKLGDICENLDSKRRPITKEDRVEGTFPYYGASGVVDHVEGFIFDEDLLLISEDGANLLARSTPIAFSVTGKIWVNNHAHVLRFAERATQRFVELFVNSIDITGYVTGSAQPKLNQSALSTIQIPLPSLETQRAIVAEIEAEQALVNANRELVRRFEAKIKVTIDRVWSSQ